MLLPLAAAATAALVALHLAGERRNAPALRVAGKLGASAVFVAVGVAVGTDGAFRVAILVALVLSAIGDALLLSRRKPLFLGGLVAFLLAHGAYAIAFWPASRPSALAGGAILVATAQVLGWLWPHAGELRPAVVAYAGVIAAMVWLALGVDRNAVRAGAVLFWLSDLTVARDRFVRPGFVNPLVGLPLYYAAQLLLASAAG
jgi:uncharacterized membrane protein YhhN